MTLFFSFISLLIYGLGIYREGIQNILPNNAGFPGYVLVGMVVCLISVFYFILEFPDVDIDNILFLFCILVNIGEAIGYGGLWLYNTCLMSQDLTIMSFLNVVGPILLLIIGIPLTAKNVNDSIYDNKYPELDKYITSLTVAKFFFYLLLMVLSVVIYFSKEVSLKMDSILQETILYLSGYKTDLYEPLRQPPPTWFNFSEWIIKLKTIGYITILLAIVILFLIIRISFKYGHILRRLFLELFWVIEFVYFFHGFLVFRRLVLFKYTIWRIIEFGVSYFLHLGFLLLFIFLAAAAVYSLGAKLFDNFT